jgi:protein phosphatase inhibitor 2
MHISRLQRPLQRAAASSSRPFSTVLRPTPKATATTTLEDRFAHLRIASPAAVNAAIEGRRYASVKSQGAYRLKSKGTIPKKMGSKKTGGTSSSSCQVAHSMDLDAGATT